MDESDLATRRPADGYFAVEAVLPPDIFVATNSLNHPAPEEGVRLTCMGIDGILAQFDMEPSVAQYVERRLHFNPMVSTTSERFEAGDLPCWPDSLT